MTLKPEKSRFFPFAHREGAIEREEWGTNVQTFTSQSTDEGSKVEEEIKTNYALA